MIENLNLFNTLGDYKMSSELSAPTLKVEIHSTDNGTPFAYSTTSHRNIKVHAEVQPPLQLLGLIIFVHGVNSEGEWYDYAENELCKGLNTRLGLLHDSGYGLKPNTYYAPHWNDINPKTWVVPLRKIKEEGRSPGSYRPVPDHRAQWRTAQRGESVGTGHCTQPGADI